MKRPEWLVAIALILWGFSIGVAPLGMGLAAVLLAVARIKPPIAVEDGSVQRLITALYIASFALLALSGVMRGVPQGLYLSVSWLPLIWVLPLLLDAAGCSQLQVSHFLVGSRHLQREKKPPEPDSQLHLSGPFAAFAVLCASLGHSIERWFFVAAASVLCVWLYMEYHKQNFKETARFATLVLVASACAWALAAGLRHAQNATQDLFVAVFSNADNDPYKSQTRIGDLGKLKLSEKIVWRAEFPKPVQMPLLLRSGVFNRYGNDQWFAPASPFVSVSYPAGAGSPLLTLSGKSESNGLLLPLPMQMSAIAASGGDIQGLGLIERNAAGIVKSTHAPNNLDVAIWTGDRDQMPAPDAADLALPKQANQWATRIPELDAVKQATDEQKLAALKTWFAKNFTYTLDLGDDANARRDLERFLFKDRAGHCEYFGTATVLLLRAQGIPARYVTGYSLQEYSELEHRYVVRLSHAHAWAQAFINGKWVEVDTTPSSWVSVQKNHASVFTRVRDVIAFAVYRITRAAEKWDATPLISVGALLLLTVVALAYFKWRRRPAGEGNLHHERAATASANSTTQTLDDYYALEREWAEVGLPRRTGETPRAWHTRVAQEGATVRTADQTRHAASLINALYLERYR